MRIPAAYVEKAGNRPLRAYAEVRQAAGILSGQAFPRLMIYFGARAIQKNGRRELSAAHGAGVVAEFCLQEMHIVAGGLAGGIGLHASDAADGEFLRRV